CEIIGKHRVHVRGKRAVVDIHIGFVVEVHGVRIHATWPRPSPRKRLPAAFQEAQGKAFELTAMGCCRGRDVALEAAVQPALENLWMDVRGPAYRRRIAQCRGHVARRLGQLPAPRGFVWRQGRGRQFTGREHGGAPGAEVLGAEWAAHVPGLGTAQVVVHHARVYRADLAPIVEVLEQMLARQLLHAANDADQAPVVQQDVAGLAALALEDKTQAIALAAHVAHAQGGQAVAPVGTGVFLVANADQGFIQQADQHGQDLVRRQAGPTQVTPHASTQARQGSGKRHHLVELALVAQAPPLRVIAVLLAPARIAAGGLQMAIGLAANPYLPIGRRYGQGADARQLPAVGDAGAIGIVITEALAAAYATEPGLFVTGVHQAGGTDGGTFGDQ